MAVHSYLCILVCIWRFRVFLSSSYFMVGKWGWKAYFLLYFIHADQDSVRLLAVEGCAALGKLLEPQDCVAHILPVIVNFSQVDHVWWMLCYKNVRISKLLHPLSFPVIFPISLRRLGWTVLYSCSSLLFQHKLYKLIASLENFWKSFSPFFYLKLATEEVGGFFPPQTACFQICFEGLQSVLYCSIGMSHIFIS